METRFNKYIGIDYSGAETPTSSLKGLRVYETKPGIDPTEVPPPAGPKRYWSRRGLAEWIIEQVLRPKPCIIGIDHAFSFPLKYFEKHKLALDWPAFLDDFQAHWPTDEDIYVDFVRDGVEGNGAARMGERKWRRLTDFRAGSAKSVFHFDVQGQVAKSTHSGLPQLRHIRNKVGSRVHFWPFDGWTIPSGKSAIVEVYPRLWNRNYPPANRTSDQQDAYSVASWLQEMDCAGGLDLYLNPELSPEHRRIASIEGWILGLR